MLYRTPESVRARLTALARVRNETPEAVFLRYARERLLYRLANSEYHDRFVLKGASLFCVWSHEPHRPTRDIDLLGFGEINALSAKEMFQSVCVGDGGPDGITFLPDSVSAEDIRENNVYGGVEVKLTGMLAGARLRVQIDIGIGDAVTPTPTLVEYPPLLPELNLPVARLRSYPKETVVAEKAETIVRLGMINSRMKDYYDLAELGQLFVFDGRVLAEALRATFDRRGTPLPRQMPPGLGDGFASDELKQRQWQAFLRRSELPLQELHVVVAKVRALVWPPLQAAAEGTSLALVWQAGGPWS